MAVAAAVSVRFVPARYRQQAAGFQRPVKVAPRLHGIETVLGERQAHGPAGDACERALEAVRIPHRQVVEGQGEISSIISGVRFRRRR